MKDEEKDMIALQSLIELCNLPQEQQQEFKTEARALFEGNAAGTAYIEALIQAAGI